MRDPQKSFPTTTIFVVLVILGIFGYLIYKFVGQNQPQISENKQLTITTSIFPVASLTRSITGNRVDVKNILPVGQIPQNYQLTEQDKQLVLQSDLVLIIGLGLDNWLKDYASTQNIKILDLSEFVALRLEGNVQDPYYWLSIDNAQKMLTEIFDQLKGQDLLNTSFYKTNYDNSFKELADLKEVSLLKVKIAENRNIVTQHDAFEYLAAEMDLDVKAVVEPDFISPPDQTHLDSLKKVFKKNQISSIFKEPQYSSSAVEYLAEINNLQIFELDPFGGAASTDSYIAMYTFNIDQLVAALK